MPTFVARKTVLGLVATAALAAGTLTAAAAPAAQRSWTAAEAATIRPGVQIVSDSGQCTSNFVFTDGRGDVYLGQAAHCTGQGSQTDINGCTTPSLPIGSEVRVKGADNPGTLAYSSWNTMQAVNEVDPNTCDYNDFALIRLHPDDVAKVNPTIPSIGGPVGLVASVASNSRVRSYGNSGLRLGLSALSPKDGISLGQSGNGWTHTVYTASPGIPGDSGSGFIDANGNAFGVLSTLAIFPLAGSNGVSDLSRALDYARIRGGMNVTLATATESFTTSRQVRTGAPAAPTSSTVLPVGNLL